MRQYPATAFMPGMRSARSGIGPKLQVAIVPASIASPVASAAAQPAWPYAARAADALTLPLAMSSATAARRRGSP